MTLTASGAPKAFLPDDFGNLLIATASKMSIALQVTTVVQTDSFEFRIPRITEEAATAWYAENADIALTDATLAEEVVRPRKIAGLSKLSNELVNDSSPAGAKVVGDSLARSLATGIDTAFFGNATGSGTPPKGIASFADGDITTVTGPSAWANVDPFIEGIFKAEALGSTVTAFVANPADAEALAKLKRETASNEPLLAPDATSPTTRRLAGVPLWTSSAVAAGSIIGLDQTRTFSIIRNGTEVELDRSVYFNSYSTGVRAVARVAFGYAHPKSIVRIKLGT